MEFKERCLTSFDVFFNCENVMSSRIEDMLYAENISRITGGILEAGR